MGTTISQKIYVLWNINLIWQYDYDGENFNEKNLKTSMGGINLTTNLKNQLS